VVVGATGDVGDEDSLRAAVDQIAGQLDGLDHLVSSAGIAGTLGDAVDQVPAEEFLEVQRINVLGPFLLAKVALPYLKSGADPTCTLIGSDSGFVAVPGMLAYNASKGAVAQLTRALSVELHEPFGIRVNSVCPSIVDTPMARDGMGMESFADVGYPVSAPEDIAWLVLTLASRRSVAVNGVSLLADYGYHARSSFPA
jgi:dihydroanticapsin dehydrogenase